MRSKPFAAKILVAVVAIGSAGLCWGQQAESALARVTLGSDFGFEVAVSAQVGATLYLSERQFTAPQCIGRNLYKVTDSQKGPEKIAELSCVRGLFVRGDTLLVGQGLDSLEFSSLQNGQLVSTRGDGSALQNVLAIARLNLFKLGSQSQVADGHLLRQSALQAFALSADGQRFLMLFETPVALQEAGLARFSVCLGDFGRSTVKLARWLNGAPKQLATGIYEVDEERFITTSWSPDKERILTLWNVSEEHPSQEPAFSANLPGSAQILSIASVPPKGVSVLKRERGLVTLWNFSPEMKWTQMSQPSRDLVSLSALPGQLYLNRLAAVDLWAIPSSLPERTLVKSLLSQAPRDAASSLYRWLPDLENAGTQTLYKWEKLDSGEVEWVKLAKVRGLTAFAYREDKLALVAEAIAPFSAPGHLRWQLEEESPERPTETNVKELLEFSKGSETAEKWITAKPYPHLLLALKGEALFLARHPFLETQFSALALSEVGKGISVEVRTPDNALAYHMQLGEPRENLYVESRKVEASQVRRERKKEAVLAERDGLLGAREYLLFSTEDIRVRPAHAILDSLGDLYFAEASNNSCGSRDVWKLAKGQQNAARFVTLDCVKGLSLIDGKAWVSTLKDGKTYFHPVGSHNHRGIPLWHGLSANQKWSLDLWNQLQTSALNLAEASVLGAQDNLKNNREFIVTQGNKVVYLRTAEDDQARLGSVAHLDLDLGNGSASSIRRCLFDSTGFLYQITNGPGDQMARLAVYDLQGAENKLVPLRLLGSDAPYLYRAPWKTRSETNWSARDIAYSTSLPYGVVLVDKTDRLNEMPVLSYYSALLEGKDVFTALPIDATEVSGVSAHPEGLVISYANLNEIRWFGQSGRNLAGEKTPARAPAGVGQTREEYLKSKQENK